ncbi:L-ascorbate peroxidase 1, cytosolic [Olea europaea subsp. europaea]|uniref:L-ascorbate peroxidase 1, cytosolic n=1 Tax=Olea europaea subsp. europaea TaxID=158383 RepID=A0A8S0VNY8_OLEEU|nr:L-ascorbate peroxidase 1, cytosolic [Olea europaea subsp. europaea]
MLVKNVADAKMTTSMEELILPNVVENVKSVPAENNKLKTDNDEDSAKQVRGIKKSQGCVRNKAEILKRC